MTAADTDENDALALKTAEKSMVLLENDGLLPLDPARVKTVAVIGPNADSIPALEGNYNGTSSRYVTFLEGIRAYCRDHGIRVLYSMGCHLFKDRTSNLAQADDRLAEAMMQNRQMSPLPVSGWMQPSRVKRGIPGTNISAVTKKIC